MALKTFQFVADTVNGEIQEFPPTMTFNCDGVDVVGMDIIKAFTVTDCIQALKVLLIRRGNNVFGSKAFSSKNQFLQYLSSSCACCPETNCYLLINGCIARINGFPVCINQF